MRRIFVKDDMRCIGHDGNSELFSFFLFNYRPRILVMKCQKKYIERSLSLLCLNVEWKLNWLEGEDYFQQIAKLLNKQK